MTVNISGPFSGYGHVVVPAQATGAPRVRETRIAITDDQATRLRAMVESMQGRRAGPPRPHAPQAAPPVVTAAPRAAKVIAVASGKGGVGKTNISVNLAIALTQLGRRVTVLDADLGMANADVLCGLTPTRRLEHYVGVAEAPLGRSGSPAARPIAELAMEAPGGFTLIPGSVGIARMTELSPLERDRLLASLAELDELSDLIIVDTGAGLGREVVSFSRAADLALVVVTPEPTSVADAYALIKCILKRDKARDLRPRVPGGETLPRVGLIVNQATCQREASEVHARMAAVCHRFLGYALPLLGWIVQDARIPASVRRRRPLLVLEPQAAAAQHVRALARGIAQELRIATAEGGATRAGGLSGLLSRVLRGG
jgi:flagellar biosynthesis protein FlhG